MEELENLWLKNKTFKDKHISQILSWISNLELEKRKEEIRKLFSIVPIEQLEKYVSECINDKFEDNGFVFQDLINELGRRLDYKVTFGRYKGVKGENGFDGLWESKEEHAFVVESKITDSFAINLNNINQYRQNLIKEGKIMENKSSIILVIGRKDSNTVLELIRGSKYKWNMTVIGVNSLIDLVKEKNDKKSNEDLDRKILDVLKMEDNVDADSLVKLLLPEKTTITNPSTILNKVLKLNEDKRPKRENVQFYGECVNKIYKNRKIKLYKKEGKSKVLYEDENKENGVVIINSNVSPKKNYDSYWFAFHKRYYNYLEEYKQKYIAFGCGSENNILLVPIKLIEENINYLNKTEKNNRIHWHIIIIHKDNKFLLYIPLNEKKWLDISEYHI